MRDVTRAPQQTTMPNPHYMENQKDLAWKMRGILIDWLIQVHSRFRLLPETLFLAVNIIDRFLSKRVVSLAKLQLVGITCMFIAAKVEEIIAPSASNFLYCAEESYTESEILQAERYVLKTIDWNLSYPNPIHFLRRISKADDYNVQVRTIGKYLLEIQCLEWRLIAAPPSLLAAASAWLARLILGFPDWVSVMFSSSWLGSLKHCKSRHRIWRTTRRTARARSSPPPVSCSTTSSSPSVTSHSTRSTLRRSS